MFVAYHVHALLKHMLGQFATSAEAWRLAIKGENAMPFPAADVDTIIESWRTGSQNSLFPDGNASSVTIMRRFDLQGATNTTIVIEDSDQPVQDNTVGQLMGASAAKAQKRGFRLNARVNLYIFNISTELCEALWTAIRGRMVHDSRRLMGDVGFQTPLMYLSGGGVDYERQLVLGWVGSAVRTLSYSVEYEIKSVNPSAVLPDDDKPIFVAASDVYDPALEVYGGISAAAVEE